MARNGSDEIGIGVIGCGVIAQFHGRALRKAEGARLIAVADIREDIARKMADEFDVPNVHTSAEALIADPAVDGVILAMPTSLRFEPALAAFAAGKHVLTEKPVAMNAGQVRDLIAARGDQIGGCCSSRFRFTETARLAKEFVASGQLGELRALHSRALLNAGPPPTAPPPAWRVSKKLNGGGILVNWGCYELDYMLGTLDWKLTPRRVLARTHGVSEHLMDRVAAGSDAEAHVTALINFDNGVAWSYERAEFYPGPAETVWEITGSRGTLRMEMLPVEGRPQLVFCEASSAGGTSETILYKESDPFDVIHEGPSLDFVRAIREGTAPRTTLEQALVAAKITDAIYQSADSGGCVEID